MEEVTTQNKFQQFKQWWNSLPKKIKINLIALTLMVLVLPISINAALHQVRIPSRANVVTPPTPSITPKPRPSSTPGSIKPSPKPSPKPSLSPSPKVR